jgi:hypothetical protein
MHLFRRAAVHPAFGIGKSPEDAFGRLLHPFGEVRFTDRLQNLLQPPGLVVMVIVEDHADVRRLDMPGDFPAHFDPVPAHAETGEPFPEPLRVRSRGDERPERHIAADSRETVEIGNQHR